jgi:hypothetical protein
LGFKVLDEELEGWEEKNFFFQKIKKINSFLPYITK